MTMHGVMDIAIGRCRDCMGLWILRSVVAVTMHGVMGARRGVYYALCITL